MAIAQVDPVAETIKNMVSPAVSGVTALPVLCDQVSLGTGTGAGGVFAWQNPLDRKVIAAVILDITAAAPATRTLDIGVAADGTTLSDTLIDGVAADAAAITNSFNQGGVNGRGFRKVDEKGGTNDFITGSSVAAGALTGMVGKGYIIYIPVS